jgi:hypothetical protein
MDGHGETSIPPYDFVAGVIKIKKEAAITNSVVFGLT